jgi:hypothetical protein
MLDRRLPIRMLGCPARAAAAGGAMLGLEPVV